MCPSSASLGKFCFPHQILMTLILYSRGNTCLECLLTTAPSNMGLYIDVLKHMDTLSWLWSVPSNFGYSATGTLKADEWHTMSTVHLPIALVSLWGEGSVHPSPAVASSTPQILDHTMMLICAISLACMRTMSKNQMDACLHYIISWLSNPQVLHSKARATTKFQLSYGNLSLWVPAYVWSCATMVVFSFEHNKPQATLLPANKNCLSYQHVWTLKVISITPLLKLPDSSSRSSLFGQLTDIWTRRTIQLDWHLVEGLRMYVVSLFIASLRNVERQELDIPHCRTPDEWARHGCCCNVRWTVEVLALGYPKLAATHGMIDAQGFPQGIYYSFDDWPRLIYLYIMDKPILLPCLFFETC